MTKFTEHLRRRWLITAPRFFAVLFASVALWVSCWALTITLKEVSVTDSDGNKKTMITTVTNPLVLMEMADIELQQYDQVFYTAYNGNLANLNIQSSFPVSVEVDGTLITANISGGTVEDILELCNVALGEHDYTEPSRHTPVQADMEITVHRVVYQDTITEEVVPYQTIYRTTSLLHRNKNKTYEMQAGSEGKNQITHRQRVVDGQVESEQIVDVTPLVAPVNEVILSYGPDPVSGIAAPAGITVQNNVPSAYTSVITNAVCTGYSSRGGRGASRLGLYAGTVAVNPAVIPYGTKMYITSADGSFVYGFAIATDTGTALQQGIIDIDLYYDSYLESVLNGKKLLNVYILP